MKVHARHHRVLATSVLLAIAGPSLAQPVTVDTITQSLPGESVSQLVERVTPVRHYRPRHLSEWRSHGTANQDDPGRDCEPDR